MMAATGGGDFDITEETENFVRFCLIVVDVFRDMLWELVMKDFAANIHALPVEISKNSGVLKLDEVQKEKIEKASSQARACVKQDFDVSGLYTILRNICPKMKPKRRRPTGGWGCDIYPTEENQRIGDDVERIRLLRNIHYGHATEGKISEDDFNRYMKEAENIATRFDTKWLDVKHNFRKQVEDVETKDLDEKQKEQYVRDVQRLWESDQENKQIVKDIQALYQSLQKAVQDLQETQNTLQETIKKVSVNTRLKNMLEQTKDRLEEAEKKICFVETKAFKTAKAILKNRRMLFLSGHPGEGKTTLAKFLLIQSDHRDTCLILTSPDELNDISEDDCPDHVSMILIDDMFGIQHYDREKHRAWKTKIAHLLKLKKNVKFIFTNREFIVKQFRSRLNLDAEKEGNEEDKKENEIFVGIDYHLLRSSNLGQGEKIDILSGHIKKAESLDKQRKGILSENDIKTCVKKFEANLAFPLCCRMFAFDPNLSKVGVDFFTRPFKALEKLMKEFWDEDKLKPNFVALTAVWYQGRSSLPPRSPDSAHRRYTIYDVGKSLLLSKFERPQFMEIADRCRLVVGEVVDLEELFFNLEDVYLSCIVQHGADNKKEKFYTFSHELIHDAFGRVLFTKFPDLVLEKCDTAFLIYNTTTKAESQNEKMKIPVPAENYPTLAKLLTKSLLNRASEFIALQHDAFTDEDFLNLWFGYVAGEDLMLKLLKQEEDDRFWMIFHSSSTLLTEAIDQDKPKEELAKRLLFQNHKLTEMPVDWVTKQKTKCLELACKAKLKGLVEDLLEDGVKLSEVSLYLSVSAGELDLVKRHFRQRDWTKEQLNTCLRLAAEKGHLHEVMYFLEQGAELESDKNPGETALYLAVMHKKEDVAVYLIEQGADINIMPSNKVKNKCLHLACQFGMFEATKMLLEKGAEIDTKNSNDTAPLHFALMFENENVALYLIDQGANVNLLGGRLDKSPLQFAAEGGLVEATKKILEKEGKVEHRDKKGHTATHYAAMEGHKEVIEELAKWGKKHVSLRAFCHMKKSEIKGFAPIHYAARRGHPKAVQALLNIPEIAPEIKDSYGRTPLYLAARFGHHEAVNILLEKSNANDVEKKLGFTALHIACDRGHAKVVEVLCESKNVRCSLPDKKGYTPLHIAAKKGDRLIVNHLLKQKADPRMKDREGNVPLHLCSNAKVVELLCQIDRTTVHIKNNNNVSPFEHAIQKCQNAGHKQVIQTWKAVLDVLDKYRDEPMQVDMDEPMQVDPTTA